MVCKAIITDKEAQLGSFFGGDSVDTVFHISNQKEMRHVVQDE